MTITKKHVSFGWGLAEGDYLEITGPAYDYSTDYATLGTDAVGGIGVRRATLVFDREAATPSDDDMNMHFSFMNITGGDPDDTWTSTDYSTLEALLATWWTTQKQYCGTYARFSRILWHKVGKGIGKPNPATRILDIVSPVNGTGTVVQPPQCACAITLRTGLRRHWGRTYAPLHSALDANGRLTSTQRSNISGAAVTLLQAALAADFQPVVYSATKQIVFGVEAVGVDDVVDIVRRRRWKNVVSKTLTSL